MSTAGKTEGALRGPSFQPPRGGVGRVLPSGVTATMTPGNCTVPGATKAKKGLGQAQRAAEKSRRAVT